MKRVALMLPSDSQVPTIGCPAFKAFLTGFVRILSPNSTSQGCWIMTNPGFGSRGRGAVLCLAETAATEGHALPTGTVGSPPSSTQTQPYWVLLGAGFCRYSSRI